MAPDPMTPSICVGVDSGGTRTNVTLRMFQPDGGTVDEYYEVGESLSGALSRELISPTLRAILARLQIVAERFSAGDLPMFLWISAAGFTPWTRHDYLDAMRDLVPSLMNGSIRLAGAANDGVSLLLGSGADVVVIAGTGSTVLLRGESGLRQAGGHEWVACDDGSGFWIGIRGIRQAYRDHEAGNESVLLQRLRDCYSVSSRDDLIKKLRELAVTNKNMKKEIARFTTEACSAAERGDKEAQNIVKIEAEALADVTATAIRRESASKKLSTGLHIVQCGSLLANGFYRKSFKNQLEMRLRFDDDHETPLKWSQVTTGADAAVRLAMTLAEDPEPLLKLDLAFRPEVFQATTD